MTADRHYDLIAIGGGSGGLAVAEEAAKLGRRVAIVEPHKLGGTCVNAGCVPKKVMWYAAHLAQAVADAPGFGLEVQYRGVDWARLVSARETYVANINAYWNDYAQLMGVDVLRGRARFQDSHTIDVDGQAYSAEHIVIATGGRPFVPAVPGADLGVTSDGFFTLDQQPRRVAVIGGGYIGVELAGMLRALGSEVSVVVRESHVLEVFDDMISSELMAAMRQQGIALHMQFPVTALERRANGVAVCAADGRCLDGFDDVIWAVGRASNSADINLPAAGVEVDRRGAVLTDAWQNTNVAGIYAIGDVTGRAPLTPVAVAAGRRLAARLFGGQAQRRLDYENVPTVVFAHPPVGVVGLTEAQARERHGDAVSVYQTRFTPMRFALAEHKMTTAMKLVCVGAEQRVVGVHLIGDGVDEMLQGFAVAVKVGITKSDLDETVAVHPTSAEELVTLKDARELAGAATRAAA